jgi:hypothetical protein
VQLQFVGMRRRHRTASLIGYAALLAALVLSVSLVNPSKSHAADATYKDEVLADSPVGYWRLGDASGTEDRSGVTLGQAGALSGDADTAARFDGTNDTVRVPHAASLNPTGAFAIETWLRPNSLASSSVVRKDLAYMLRLTSGGGITFRIWKGSTANELQVNSAVASNAWSHVVANWDGTTMQIWIDGVLRASRALSGPAASNTQPLYFGSAYQSYDWLNGSLDEVAVYDHALSAARIRAHHDDSA